MDYDVVIAGAGASGLTAAIAAGKRGLSVLLVEHKKQAGSKILVTGKGRCNITNECDVEQVMQNVMSNRSFLYSALYSFPPSDIIAFFNEIGVATVTERGTRVFPKSQKAADVRNALVRACVQHKVNILLKNRVTEIKKNSDGQMLVFTKDESEQQDVFYCTDVIIATGGLSYSSTGSDGSGYAIAKKLGHTVTCLKGALTGLLTKEKWPSRASGLTLKNVSLTIKKDDKKLYYEQGELLLTHFGISGPIVLTASRYLLDTGYKNCTAHIDLKPALDEKTLYKRITSDFEKNAAKSFANSLDDLLPQSLIPIIVDLSGIDPSKTANQISKQEKSDLVHLLKNIVLSIKSGQNIEDAVVTKGGIQVNEINPSTMQSLISPHIYFAGEIIDVDALTGGYNLTIAFSTGWLAGNSVCYKTFF